MGPPILFALKKDGTTRFCVLYCMLNAVNIWEFYPVLCINERIDSLGNATIFSTLDANSN